MKVQGTGFTYWLNEQKLKDFDAWEKAINKIKNHLGSPRPCNDFVWNLKAIVQIRVTGDSSCKVMTIALLAIFQLQIKLEPDDTWISLPIKYY